MGIAKAESGGPGLGRNVFNLKQAAEGGTLWKAIKAVVVGRHVISPTPHTELVFCWWLGTQDHAERLRHQWDSLGKE